MPKTPKFRPVKSPEGWRLNVPAKLALSGKRERYFFRTKELALEEAGKQRERLEEFGAQAFAISPSLAELATKAAALLDPFGISILEAAARIAEMETAKAASMDVEAATAAFEKDKEKLSDKQTDAISRACKHLREDFPKRNLSTITAEEIAAHIAKRTNGNTAYNGRRRILVTLWRWAAKPPRGWCRPDALQHVETIEVTDSEIGILTSKEVARLLATAEAHYPECVPAFAIALTTGLRQAELERLSPSDITDDGISVPKLKAKGGKRRRFIQMTEQLKAWLAAYPITDYVVPPNWARKEKTVRRLAGWKVWTDMVEPAEAPEDAPEWPQNALRHTAASVAVAQGKELSILIFEHGHAKGVELLKSHYVGVMSKKEAVAIAAIGPHGTKIATIKPVEAVA